jgi:hypothetical protein
MEANANVYLYVFILSLLHSMVLFCGNLPQCQTDNLSSAGDKQTISTVWQKQPIFILHTGQGRDLSSITSASQSALIAEGPTLIG